MNSSFEGDLWESTQRLLSLILRYNAELKDYEFINTIPQQKLLMKSMIGMAQTGILMGTNRELWTEMEHSLINQLKHISEMEQVNEQSENRH